MDFEYFIYSQNVYYKYFIFIYIEKNQFIFYLNIILLYLFMYYFILVIYFLYFLNEIRNSLMFQYICLLFNN